MHLHPQAKEILTVKLPSWQDKCTDATRVPDTVISMIENLRTPMSVIPESSPTLEHSDRVSPMLEHDVPPFNLHMTMFKCLLTLWHLFFFFFSQTNSGSIVPPPAPSLKAHTSPLANMFSQDIPKSPISSEHYSGKLTAPSHFDLIRLHHFCSQQSSALVYVLMRQSLKHCCDY